MTSENFAPPLTLGLPFARQRKVTTCPRVQPASGPKLVADSPVVIPFPTEIAFGKNLFGDDLAGGDATLDATWFSTRIAGAGIHFEGYNEPANGYSGTPPLSRTPTAYLVPVGEDRMRAPGDADKVISWRVVELAIRINIDRVPAYRTCTTAPSAKGIPMFSISRCSKGRTSIVPLPIDFRRPA